MKIKIKLWLLKEIDQRNEKRIKAYEEKRKPPSQPHQEKPMRNRAKPKERLE